MPSITKQGQLGVIRYDQDDFLRGLAPNWGFNGQNHRLARGLSYTQAIDPNRRPGFLLPGYSPSQATNASAEMDGVPVAGVADGSVAYIGAAGELHELTISGNTITSGGGSFPHAIDHSHASETVEDVVAYTYGGKRYLMYSFRDATDWDIGRYDIDADTFDDDFMTTVPSTPLADNWGGDADADYLSLGQDKPHPSIVGDDNIYYCGNANHVVSFNGPDSSFNGSALDLPTGYIITTFSKTPNFLVIYAYIENNSADDTFSSQCTAFFWDYVSSSFTYSFDIPGNFVNGGFLLGGVPGCFAGGASFDTTKDNRLMLFDGTVFKPVATFEDKVPAHRGVISFDDTIVFNAGSAIYQYGSQHVGFDRALNKIGRVVGESTAGMIANFKTGEFHVGVDDAGDLHKFSTGYDAAECLFPLVAPNFSMRKQGKLKGVKVYWYDDGQGSDTNFDLTISTDRGDSEKTVISNLDDPGALVTLYEQLADGTNMETITFESLRLRLVWGDSVSSEPVGIRAIEIFYEEINL